MPSCICNTWQCSFVFVFILLREATDYIFSQNKIEFYPWLTACRMSSLCLAFLRCVTTIVHLHTFKFSIGSIVKPCLIQTPQYYKQFSLSLEENAAPLFFSKFNPLNMDTPLIQTVSMALSMSILSKNGCEKFTLDSVCNITVYFYRALSHFLLNKRSTKRLGVLKVLSFLAGISSVIQFIFFSSNFLTNATWTFLINLRKIT